MKIYVTEKPEERPDIKTAWAMVISKYIIKPKTKAIIDRIKKVVGAHFRVNLYAQTTRFSENKFVNARYVCILLLKELSDFSNVEIGQIMGYADHTCVNDANKKYKESEDLRKAHEELKHQI